MTSTLLHQLVERSANKSPEAIALRHKQQQWSYQEFAQSCQQIAQALLSLDLIPQQRVGVYLPKQIETAASFFAIPQAGGVFVPINPVLKAPQVGHILRDCDVQILITSSSRVPGLSEELQHSPELHTVVIIEDKLPELSTTRPIRLLTWQDFLSQNENLSLPRIIDTQMAAILYTSGSTGKPKGVVLSHRNIVAGAESVSEYLNISSQDNLLAVLPFSFDYGLNQLISTVYSGAGCTLLDYLLPRDVIKTLESHLITGLAAVPPLWSQLAQLDWPESINNHLRYMTNSGGKMPKTILQSLRQKVPNSQFFLMYGLTEAFRSTYLPPEQIDIRPDSMGKAIPNAEILVVREDGSPCAPHEPGELVHKGSLVAMGYWNDPEKTAERFRPAPDQLKQLPLTEIAVWSGDQVRMDEEGYLYFVGRKDDMIKTSGYRVSPTEIEEVFYSSGLVKEAAALGIEHPTLGQAIVVIIKADPDQDCQEQALINLCKQQLPNFMVPNKIIMRDNLPKNPNGKIDRKQLSQQYAKLFTDVTRT